MKKLFLFIYLFCSIFTMNAQNGSIREQIEAGIKTSLSQSENREWKDAFTTCRDMDAIINIHERKTQTKSYDLHYLVSKERLRIYIRLMNTEKCKVQLQQMLDYTLKAGSEELKADYLLSKADFHQSFGQTAKSIECYKEYISLKTHNENEENIKTCYETLIREAKDKKNSSLSYALTTLYTNWQDSIQAVKDQIEIKELKDKSTKDQQTLQEKEDKISNYWSLILLLCLLTALLILGICILGGITIRYIQQNKKLNTSLKYAQSNHELICQFIGNIQKYINPSLLAIKETASTTEILKQTDAMEHFFADIEKFTELERTRDERYHLKELNINDLCKKILEQAKKTFRPEVEAILEVPRVNIHTEPEALTYVLLYLLENASQHTTHGKITLEFKKRSAHSGQFIISDTGCGIPEDKRESLFRPFAENQDLTEGDGLGLPTCNLIAYKLNGTLRLDESYKKGTRFILELHS